MYANVALSACTTMNQMLARGKIQPTRTMSTSCQYSSMCASFVGDKVESPCKGVRYRYRAVKFSREWCRRRHCPCVLRDVVFLHEAIPCRDKSFEQVAILHLPALGAELTVLVVPELGLLTYWDESTTYKYNSTTCTFLRTAGIETDGVADVPSALLAQGTVDPHESASHAPVDCPSVGPASFAAELPYSATTGTLYHDCDVVNDRLHGELSGSLGEHRRGICAVECVAAHLRGFEEEWRSEVFLWIDEWSIEFGYHCFDVAHVHDHSPIDIQTNSSEWEPLRIVGSPPHRGLVRGSYPAPHHHDPNEMLPHFCILGCGGVPTKWLIPEPSRTRGFQTSSSSCRSSLRLSFRWPQTGAVELANIMDD